MSPNGPEIFIMSLYFMYCVKDYRPYTPIDSTQQGFRVEKFSIDLTFALRPSWKKNSLENNRHTLLRKGVPSMPPCMNFVSPKHYG